jgi:hypothetical protein
MSSEVTNHGRIGEINFSNFAAFKISLKHAAILVSWVPRHNLFFELWTNYQTGMRGKFGGVSNVILPRNKLTDAITS